MKWHWLKLVEQLAPVVLSIIPGTAGLAPIVAVAIQTAEAIPGASSAQKLAHAQSLVVAGAAATNVLAGHQVIDPVVAQQVGTDAISTIVDTANLIHLAHAPVAAQ
jgi:hypothetical protein